MKKVYIFGAGFTGSKIAELLRNIEILGVLDNSQEKWGKIYFSDSVVGGGKMFWRCKLPSGY